MGLQDKDNPAQHFSLQPSEMAIFRGACEIYAAYVAAGQVNAENAAQFHKRSIQEAIRIGMIVERAVESDEELKNEGSTGLGGSF